MLEQQAKEMPRRGEAASEPVDETLSVVRQLMAEQSPPSAPPPRAAAIRKAEAEAMLAAPAAPRRREKPVRGRAALPELDAPAPASSQSAQERQEPPATRPRAILPGISMLRRLAALWPRRARAEEAEETEEVDLRATLAVAGERHAQALPEAEPEQRTPGQRTLVQAIREFRPTRKQIALAVLTGIVLWRPWLIPGLLFVTFWVALIAYLTLGPDRAGEIAQGRWRWFSARFPERAERLMVRAQRWADRVDGWLARLPERWTDGIYLPDLGRSQAEAGPVEAQPDPFERLAAEQQATAGKLRQA